MDIDKIVNEFIYELEYGRPLVYLKNISKHSIPISEILRYLSSLLRQLAISHSNCSRILYHLSLLFHEISDSSTVTGEKLEKTILVLAAIKYSSTAGFI